MFVLALITIIAWEQVFPGMACNAVVTSQFGMGAMTSRSVTGNCAFCIGFFGMEFNKMDSSGTTIVAIAFRLIDCGFERMWFILQTCFRHAVT